MASIFNIIEDNLSELRLQTELLEACDWDETLLEEFSSHLQLAFHHISKERVGYEEGKSLLKEILQLNDWTETHYDIVVRLIEFHEKEIKEFMIGGNEQ